MIFIRDLHAAGIVQQHRDEVLLRHGGFHNQDRAEQTKDDKREERDPQAREHQTIAQPQLACDRPVGRNGDSNGGYRKQCRRVRSARRAEAKFALREDYGPVMKQQLEEAVEHAIPRILPD